MENKKAPEICEAGKFNDLYGYLTTGSAIGLILSLLIISTSWLKWVGACMLVICTLILLLVLPIIDWINEGFSSNRFLICLDILINAFLSIILCILFYNIFLVPSLGDKPYYNIINKIGITALAFFIIKLIIVCIKKIAKEWRSDKNKFSVIAGNILYFVFLLFLIFMTLSNMYKSEATVYIKDIKIPSELHVQIINEKVTFNNSLQDRKTSVLKDERLINTIFNEMNNKQYKNIRNLDDFNNQFFNENSYPYYEIFTVYEGAERTEGLISNIDKGYIHRIKVYSSGLVIITDNRFIDAKFSRSFFPNYRINLTDSTKKELLNAIKSLE